MAVCFTAESFAPSRPDMIRTLAGVSPKVAQREEDIFHAVYSEVDGVTHVPVKVLTYCVQEFRRRAIEEIIPGFKWEMSPDTVWDLAGIEAMILKGANIASMEYTRSTVDIVLASIEEPESRHIVGVELGCGAGWSTAILYEALRGKYGNGVTLFTIDSSPFAVAATTVLLEYFGVNYKVVRGVLENADREFNGVIIQLEDFEQGVGRHDTVTLDFAYSNHGTAYLDREQHTAVGKALNDRLRSGASFITDSLDPRARLALSKPAVFGRFVTGGNVIRGRERGMGHNVRTHGDVQEVTWLGGEAERRFMDFMHKLLIRCAGSLFSRREFFQYVRILRVSEKAQQRLFTQIKTPSAALVRDGISGTNFEVVPAADTLTAKLPPFIQTARLRKKPI